MKAERIVDIGKEALAYKECLEELKERLWKEEWKDMIDVPNRTTLSREGDKVKVTVETCITNGKE